MWVCNNNQSRMNIVNEHRSRRSTDSAVSGHAGDFSADQSQINTVLSSQLRKLFNTAITINMTAFEGVGHTTSQKVFIGTKTEVALLNFVKELRRPSPRKSTMQPMLFKCFLFRATTSHGRRCETRERQLLTVLEGG
jgi:hypothetical protein